jgi:hypothetical protein
MTVREELKEKFQQDLTESEKVFFLKTAREAIHQKGYRASEDLFYYCYFHTMKERMRAIAPTRGNGYLRPLLIEGTKEIDDAIMIYKERLEHTKQKKPGFEDMKFIEYFSQ